MKTWKLWPLAYGQMMVDLDNNLSWWTGLLSSDNSSSLKVVINWLRG